AFRQSLSETGFDDGRNVTIENSWDGRYETLPARAADLARRQVSVIVATSTPAALAAKMATPTVPVGVHGGGDPGGAGGGAGPPPARRQPDGREQSERGAWTQAAAVAARGGAIGAPHRGAGQPDEPGLRRAAVAAPRAGGEEPRPRAAGGAGKHRRRARDR